MNVTTAAKFIAVIVLGLLAFTAVRAPAHVPRCRPAAHAVGLSLIASALIPVLWTYDGWSNLTSVGGEVSRPQTTLPVGLVLGTACVVLVYVLLNLGFWHVLSASEMAHSPLVAATAAARIPAIGSAGAASGRGPGAGVQLQRAQRLDDDRSQDHLRHGRPRAFLPSRGPRLAPVQESVGRDRTVGGPRMRIRTAERLRAARRPVRPRGVAVLCARASRECTCCGTSGPTCRGRTGSGAIRCCRRCFCSPRLALMGNALVTDPRDTGITLLIIAVGLAGLRCLEMARPPAQRAKASH